MPLSGAKPVFAPYRGGAYHQFTGGYDLLSYGTLPYPEGFLVEKGYLLTGNTTVANRIVWHVENKVYANDFMPGGTYLTAWGKGWFEDAEPVYQRLLQYVRETGTHDFRRCI